MQRMGAGANTLTHRTTLYTFLFKPTSIILTHPSSQPLSHPQTLYHTHAPTITPSNTNPLSHPHTRPPPYNTPMQVFRFDRVLWSHPSLRPSWGKNTDGAPGDPPLFLSILYTPAIDPLRYLDGTMTIYDIPSLPTELLTSLVSSHFTHTLIYSLQKVLPLNTMYIGRQGCRLSNIF